jgi:predicted dienelactone hydrolase
MIIRIVAVLAAVIAAIWLFASYSKIPEQPSSDLASAKWLAHSIYEVGFVAMELKDRSRATSSNKEYSGASSRQFEGGLWYPAVEGDAIAPGLHPLVIYSHGFGSNYSSGEYLAENLASRGYIVLSMNYPLTNMDAPGGLLVRDVANQPADISFFIDSLLAMNTDRDSFLHQRIDATSIGAMGISLGGMTTTMAAFHPSKGDDRIKAAISLAGLSAMFSEKFYQHKELPFLMIAADQDVIASYVTNAQPVLERVGGATLINIKGGSHIGFSSFAGHLRWLNNPDIVACWSVMRNLQDESVDELGSWHDEIGLAAEGVLKVVEMPLCPEQLPKSINPLRQQQLTQMAVASFFEMVFAQTQTERDRARQYLATDFTTENLDVTLETGAIKVN